MPSFKSAAKKVTLGVKVAGAMRRVEVRAAAACC